MTKRKTISEAPESNAGDDFHRLWAAKKSLDLLNFDVDGLKLLVIEGVQIDEEKEIDPTGEKLLGIDLAEYYGGEDFNSAKTVVFSQLKYSTRRADQSFTVSRLTKGKKGNYSGSIVRRLSAAFAGYYHANLRSQILAKLKIKLISNRKIQPQFLSRLSQIQTFLQGETDSVTSSQLRAKFPQFENDLAELYACSNLKSREFTDFIRVLDFTECGVESRATQRQALINSIVSVNKVEFENYFNSLYVLVNDQMMPENIGKGLTIHSIVYLFKVGNIDNLFPVRPKFERLDRRIERTQAKNIVEEITSSEEPFICLHGGAGVGKTTIVQNIVDLLPKEYVSIIYDCYGQGTYLDSNDLRHLPQNAFLQIINELAQKVGTNFLLDRNYPIHLLNSDLAERLNHAVKILANASSNSGLLIIIDAADNSIVAARERNDRCFIQELVGISEIPKNCKIVFTCRTSRIDSLELPDKTKTLQLDEFNIIETRAFVSQFFPKISDDQVQEFHTLTNGIPRVQSYSLQNKESLNQTFSFLKPYGKTVGTLIDGHIEESEKRLGDKKKVGKLLSILIALPRPIPFEFVSIISESTEEEVRDFCNDLWTGIVSDSKHISFRDEDFETHLKEKFPLSNELAKSISKTFLDKANQNKYASKNLANSLYNSKEFDELQLITLEQKFTDVFTDPFEEREVFIERARLAIRSSINQNDDLTFLKLLFNSAAAEKSNKAQMKIIQENVDLVIRNSDLRTIQKLYLDITEDVTYGAANWQCAAIFSRTKASVDYAKRHLIQGNKWNEVRQRLSEDERRKYRIYVTDIAAAAEAYLRIDGFDKAEGWIKIWQPRKILVDIVSELIHRVVNYSKNMEISTWIRKVRRVDVKLLIASKLISTNRISSLDFDLSDIVLRLQYLCDRGVIISESLISNAIDLCEYLIFKNGFKDEYVKLLKSISISPPDHSPSFYSITQENEMLSLDNFIRIKSLISSEEGNQLLPSDLYSERIKEKIEEEKKDKRYDYSSWNTEKRVSDLYSRLIDIYGFRSKVILRKLTSQVAELVGKEIKNVFADYSFNYNRNDIDGIITFCISKLVEVTRYVRFKELYLRSIEENASYHKLSKIRIRLSLASEGALFSTTYDYSFKLLSEIDEELVKNDWTANDKVETYQECIKVALTLNDDDEAKLYFDRAIEVASKIDLEAHDQIRALSEVTHNFSHDFSNPRLAYEFSRYCEESSNVLSGYDGFPWHSAIRGISRIDYNSALATWCRWDHKGIEVDSDSHYRFWSEMLIDALRNQKVNPLEAYCLTTLHLFDHEWFKLIDMILGMLGSNRIEVSKVIGELHSDLTIKCPIPRRKILIKDLVDILDKYNLLDDRSSLHLIEISKFLDDIDFDLERNNGSSNPESKKLDKKLEKLIKTTNPTDSESINNGIESLNGGQFSYNTVCVFLEGLRNKTKPADYIGHLDALTQLNSVLITDYVFMDSIEKSLERWSHKQTVKQWKKSSLRKIVRKVLIEFKPTYRGEGYYDFSSLFKVARIMNIPNREVAIEAKEYIPGIIDSISLEALYDSVSLFSELIDEKDSTDLIDWILGIWNKDLSENIGEGLWSSSLEPQTETVLNFGAYLRYFLGHPEKSERWRAAHTIVRLCEVVPGNEIISYLLENKDNENCYPYQHRNHTFFFLSAKLWLYIACERVSRSVPNTLTQYFDLFKEDVLQVKNGHVLIRNLAKSICIRIYENNNSVASPATIDSIRSTLTQKFDPIDYEENRGVFRPQKDLKFDFDLTDTEPYWYSDLADIFGLSDREITIMADNYVTNFLGYTGDVNEQDHVKSDWRETSNNHGAIPKVENLRRYIEYHMMFLVGNELYENRATAIDRYDEESHWQSWLDRWGISMEHDWLSNLRDATPSKDRYWISNFSKSNEWKWGITSDYLDKVADLQNESDFYVLSNHHGINDEKCSETVEIHSALVNRARAESLLLALQSTINSNDFKLPDEGEDEFRINESGFQLEPLIRTYNIGYYKGLDVHDPYALSISDSIVEPADMFVKWADLEFDNNRKKSWTKYDNSKIISQFVTWSDYYDKKERMSGFGSNGRMLMIRKEVIRKFLEEKDFCVIVECRVSRYISKEDYEYSRDVEEYGGTGYYTKLYLIYSDGSIKSI